MIFLEDCTKELVEKMLEEGRERLERHEIEALVMERAKYLERDSSGGYRYKKPHKAKARTKCEYCGESFVKIAAHIERNHKAIALEV